MIYVSSLVSTEKHIDGFINLDVEMLRCKTWGGAFALCKNYCRGMLSLCISDAAKPMLLRSPDFIPHLLDGLMLDPEHPRHKTQSGEDAPLEIKTAVQRDFAECIQQISLFEPSGRDHLKANPEVVSALDTMKDKAWSEEAKICVEGALKQLCPERYQKSVVIDPDSKHIMMSCEYHPFAAVAPKLQSGSLGHCMCFTQINGMFKIS